MQEPIQGPTLRGVMASFPTGVTIVAACGPDGEPYGLTVNSFTSVSLTPPLVSVCIGHSSTWHDRLVEGQSFAVNILSGHQGEVAMRFATEPSEGRFEGVSWSPGPGGDPRLDGALGWLDCEIERVLVVGDHSIVIGEVRSADAAEGEALMFHRGRLGSTGE